MNQKEYLERRNKYLKDAAPYIKEYNDIITRYGIPSVIIYLDPIEGSIFKTKIPQKAFDLLLNLEKIFISEVLEKYKDLDIKFDLIIRDHFIIEEHANRR